MKTRRWLRFLAAGAAIFAIMLFAACGGDDDDDDTDSDDNGSESSDSTNTPSSSGGNTSSGGGGNASSSDKKYVASICKATLEFTNAFSAINPSSLTDESKVFEVLEKPFNDYVKALDDADPPKDFKDYHNQAVDQMKVILKAIKDRDQDALDNIQEADFPEPPAGLQARLEDAAKDNKDCKEANVNFAE